MDVKKALINLGMLALGLAIINTIVNRGASIPGVSTVAGFVKNGF